VQQLLEKEEFRKKLKQDIQEYEGLRDSIRKFKAKDTKIKRTQSERKVSVGLKLKNIESPENINK
jgi:chromatin segregation and condensation protein Rec8/ScpA/Scc1 (kleisin family)